MYFVTLTVKSVPLRLFPPVTHWAETSLRVTGCLRLSPIRAFKCVCVYRTKDQLPVSPHLVESHRALCCTLALSRCPILMFSHPSEASETCALIKDTGRRLPLQLQCSYQRRQGNVSQSVLGN